MAARRFAKLALFLVITLAVLLWVLRATGFHWMRVPADDPYLQASVAPTLSGGDLVVVWRRKQPRFGDLVVCAEPRAEERIVIARLVGTPGDRVEIKGTNVRVNGRTLGSGSSAACPERTFVVEDPVTRAEVEQPCDSEDLGGREHLRGNLPPGKNPLPVTLEAGASQGILVSDNRMYPYDSRDFGAVELAKCTGTVVFRLVSARGFSDVQSRLSVIR